MGFSGQEYLNRLSCPLPGDLPNPGIKPSSPVAHALKVDSLLLSHQGSPYFTEMPEIVETAERSPAGLAKQAGPRNFGNLLERTKWA